MFNDYSAINNKQQKLPKVFFQQYLYNAHEPFDDIANDIPPELEGRLDEDSHLMKQHFRHVAQRLSDRQ